MRLAGTSLAALLLLAGCAAFQAPEPVTVNLAGVEALEGEGLELRMLVKLRVQNPNDAPLDFNGLSLQMDVRDKRFATGVSDAAGTIPRFGETIVAVPVSISMIHIYEITGRFGGAPFGAARFSSKGELTLPAELFGGGK
jgi:LEA14-like dessication related protein